MTAPQPTPRDTIIAALVAAFRGNPTPYDPEDPAEHSCNKVFRASDGFNSITALTYGEIADVLAGLVRDPVERAAYEAWLARLTQERDEARALVELFRTQRNAALAFTDELAAGSSGLHRRIAAELRNRLGVPDAG